MQDSRRKLFSRSLQVAGIAILAILAVVALGPSDAATSYRASGKPLPMPERQLAPVTAEEFGGVMVGLRGRPVVVNVWASWCPPCRAEMPLLDRAADDYRGRVVFLGVASKDSPSAAADFLDEVGVDYPSVFDVSGKVRGELGLRGFPTTYLFDADGKLREAVVGGITEQRLVAQLEDLLG